MSSSFRRSFRGSICVGAFTFLVLPAMAAAGPSQTGASIPSEEGASNVLAGAVNDAQSGDPIAGAEIRLTSVEGGVERRTTSWRDGRFAFNGIPAGTYRVTVHAMGYRPTAVDEVTVLSDQVVDIELSLARQAIALQEVVVSPGQFGILEGDPAGIHSLGRRDIETRPQLGEDLFRTISNLPGIAADDYNAGLHVRGGRSDETLFLIDGAAIYEPYHIRDLGGVFSIVDVRMIGGVDLIPGSFTAEHGDRLAGVLNMRTIAAPENTRHSAGISLSNARIASTGTFSDGRGQWLFSARRGYLDVLLELLDQADDLLPRYNDLLAKLQYRVAEGHVLSLHALRANESLQARERTTDLTTEYGNNTYWINWVAQPGSALTIRTSLATNRLASRRELFHDDDHDLAVDLHDDQAFVAYTLRQDYEAPINEAVLLRWGGDVRRGAAVYNYQLRRQTFQTGSEGRVPEVDSTEVREQPRGRGFGLYGASRVRVAEPFIVETGLRFDTRSHTADAVWSPRVNVQWHIRPNTSARLGWGHFHQSQELFQLDATDGETEFFGAERAEHRTISVQHTVGAVAVRAEIYDRRLSDLRPRYENLMNLITVAPEAIDDRVRIEPSTGFARGIELVLTGRPAQSLNWSLGYTLAQSYEAVDGVMIPRARDQRHAVRTEAGFRPNDRWDLSAAWQYRSGRPYTPVTVHTETLPDGFVHYDLEFGSLRSERLPAYHRLDLRATRHFDLGQSRLSAFLDLFNAYGRENVRASVQFPRRSPDGQLEVEDHRVAYLPLLPSFGVSWDF